MFVVQIVNMATLALGGLASIGVLVWLSRRGRWRNPLHGLSIPTGGPSIAGLALVVVAFLVASTLVAHFLPAEAAIPPDPAAVPQPATLPDDASHGEPSPGSAAWHRRHAADQACSLAVSAVMLVLLRRTRQKTGTAWRLRQKVGAALVGLLVAIPLTTLQVEMGRVIWEWVHPGAPPPVHVVLEALARSAWGRWGVAQILVGATVIAPATEELFFRGVLLQVVCYHVRHAWAAIGFSAIAFGLAHAQPQDILPLTSLGVILGYLRLRSGALWPCVLLHTLFNMRTLVFVLLAPELLTEH